MQCLIHVLTPPIILRLRQRALLVLSASVITCVVLASNASHARADVQIGGDLDYVLPLESRAEMGAGFAVRLGWQLHLPMLVLTPEAAFNYAGFSDTYGPAVYRTVAGLRIGVGEVFRLGAFTHGGLGHLSASVPGADPTRTGFTYDIGIFFAFTLLPLLNLGVHAAYDAMPATDDPSFQWLTFGVHAELIL